MAKCPSPKRLAENGGLRNRHAASSVAHVLTEYAGSLRPRLALPEPRHFLANVSRMDTKWNLNGVLLLAVLGAGLLAGCESTQDKSRRLAAQGGSLGTEKGVTVARRAKDVKVVSTAVVSDQNGTAVVATLRNTSAQTLRDLPISIDVLGAHGRSVFRNDQPGLEPTLAHVPLLRPRETFTWVNDQVTATGPARSVRVIVGRGSAVDAARLPRILVRSGGLQQDPVSGTAAVGFAANQSKADLHKVVVFAVARRGGRVVAAGRGQIPRLKPGKRVRYQAFFIGNAHGAHVAVSAPPPLAG